MKKVLLSLTVLSIISLNAGNLEQGIKAYQEGNAKADISFFKNSCVDGYVNGCYNAGSMYHQGLGAKKDISKAMNLYSIACDNGYHDGCYNLGIMYYKGKDIAKNYSKAKLFFTKSYKIDPLDVDSRLKAGSLKSQGY